MADIRTILTYSLKYYIGIALPCVFAVSVLSKPILLVLSTQQIATNGYLVTPFVAAGTALVGAYAVLVTILSLEKKTAFIGTIWMLAAALNFGLNLVLIPYLGLIGAALTTFLAFLLAFVLTAIYSTRHFKFDVNGRIRRKERLRLRYCRCISVLMESLWALKHSFIDRTCRSNLFDYYVCAARFHDTRDQADL